jgi:hypothetical protein
MKRGMVLGLAAVILVVGLVGILSQGGSPEQDQPAAAAAVDEAPKTARERFRRSPRRRSERGASESADQPASQRVESEPLRASPVKEETPALEVAVEPEGEP